MIARLPRLCSSAPRMYSRSTSRRGRTSDAMINAAPMTSDRIIGDRLVGRSIARIADGVAIQQSLVVAVTQRRSHSDDRHHVLESEEVFRITGIEMEPVGSCSGGDQEFGYTRTTRTPGSAGGGEDARTGAGSIGIEGQRVPRGGCPLQLVLPARSFLVIVGRVRPRGEFSERDRRNRRFVRQSAWIEDVVINDDRGIE